MYWTILVQIAKGLDVVALTPDEIISALERKGVSISRKTLINYEAGGFISKPDRGGHGQGRGRYTYYADNVPKTVYSIYHGYNTEKLTPWELQKNFKIAIKFDTNPFEFLENIKLLASVGFGPEFFRLTLHNIISPAWRLIAWREFFQVGCENEGIRITYIQKNATKIVDSKSYLYKNDVTLCEIWFESQDGTQDHMTMPIFPAAALSDEGIQIDTMDFWRNLREYSFLEPDNI